MYSGHGISLASLVKLWIESSLITFTWTLKITLKKWINNCYRQNRWWSIEKNVNSGNDIFRMSESQVDLMHVLISKVAAVIACY